MILLVCCIYSATAAIRHLGKLGMNPSLYLVLLNGEWAQGQKSLSIPPSKMV